MADEEKDLNPGPNEVVVRFYENEDSEHLGGVSLSYNCSYVSITWDRRCDCIDVLLKNLADIFLNNVGRYEEVMGQRKMVRQLHEMLNPSEGEQKE